jgi:hypothetical protein
MLVASSFVSPTRLSSLTSPVRHVRRRLISTTRLPRRATMRSKTTNKETGATTPVLMKRILAAAIHMAAMKKGIRPAGLFAAHIAACSEWNIAAIVFTPQTSGELPMISYTAA